MGRESETDRKIQRQRGEGETNKEKAREKKRETKRES